MEKEVIQLVNGPKPWVSALALEMKETVMLRACVDTRLLNKALKGNISTYRCLIICCQNLLTLKCFPTWI